MDQRHARRKECHDQWHFWVSRPDHARVLAALALVRGPSGQKVTLTDFVVSCVMREVGRIERAQRRAARDDGHGDRPGA